MNEFVSFLQVVSGFEVTRRILVDLEGIGLKRKWLAGLEPEKVHMMIGRLIPLLGLCKKVTFFMASHDLMSLKVP